MSTGAGGSKGLWIGVGIVVLIVLVLYFSSEVKTINVNLEEIKDRLAARPKVDPKNAPPIDIAPQAAQETSSTIVVPVQSGNLAHSVQSGLQIIEKQALAAIPQFEIHSDQSQNGRAESLPELKHSEDFRTIYHNGREYHLTLNQARVVERLWVALQNKTPEVHQSTLLERLEIYSRRVRDVFKNSPALGTLVVKGERKGNFRLNLKPNL